MGGGLRPARQRRRRGSVLGDWSEALVALLEAKGIAGASDILALTERWQAAAKATPHGKPILLSAAD
jgi:hypothetical protein